MPSFKQRDRAKRVEPVEVPLCSFALQPAQLLQILAAFHQR